MTVLLINIFENAESELRELLLSTVGLVRPANVGTVSVEEIEPSGGVLTAVCKYLQEAIDSYHEHYAGSNVHDWNDDEERMYQDMSESWSDLVADCKEIFGEVATDYVLSGKDTEFSVNS